MADVRQTRQVGGLLIVGNSGGTNVAASFERSARQLGLVASLFDSKSAQSSSRLVNSLHWRLHDKRSPSMAPFGARLLDSIGQSQPRYLLTTGLAPVSADVLRAARQQGVLCLHYSTDDPWNPTQRAEWFLQALPFYDLVFTPRQSNLVDFRALGCANVHYLPFAYDDAIFDPRLSGAAMNNGKVLFVGGADRDRVSFIEQLLDIDIPMQLVGGYWERYKTVRNHALGHKTPQELVTLTRAAALNLCLVRRANRDGHVMRSFEIAALGGCMLVEDTAEHRAIFGPEGECVFYFDGPQQAAGKIKMLLADNARRRRLGAAVQQRIEAGGNTYTHRLKALLAAASDLRAHVEDLTT